MKIVQIIFISLIISIVVLIIYIINNKIFTRDYFENPKKPIERTKLYKSLFLDNLNGVIKNLSDPDIKYESQRIELNKYSDILL